MKHLYLIYFYSEYYIKYSERLSYSGDGLLSYYSILRQIYWLKHRI